MNDRDGAQAVGGVDFPESGTLKRQQSVRPIVLLSARPADIEADCKHVSPKPDRFVTLFASDAPHRGQGLFDALATGGGDATGLRGNRLVLGVSLKRLDLLVRDALMALTDVPPSSRPGDIAGGLSLWIEDYARGRLATTVPQRSVSYALFSASLRSRILSHLLRRLISPSQAVRIVDHGANIGLLMLCASYGLPRQELAVFCSEIDRTAVKAGQMIWSSCGLTEAITYQPVSAVEFNHPDDVDLVFFGQMLFRIPREARAGLLHRAWAALRPGGFLAINEIMNRRNAAASSDLLASDELLVYLPPEAQVAAYFDFDNPHPVPPREAAQEAFGSSENCIVAIKPAALSVTVAAGAPSKEAKGASPAEATTAGHYASTDLTASTDSKPVFKVTMIVPTVLRYDEIAADATGTDLAYLEGRLNMEGVTERFIDYIGAKRTNLIGGSGSLLDSGCGNGRFCEAFAGCYDVTGEDLSRGGIYRALQRARERNLNIRYRLADSLVIDDVFDVVFLRGPSYLVAHPALSDEFTAALEHMIQRARRKLVFVSYSISPFGMQNRSKNWMHDPEHIAQAFTPHGGAAVSYEDNYIVATWLAPSKKRPYSAS